MPYYIRAMLLSWIVKTIPRSPRAFLALLIMVGSVSLLFSSLTGLFDPSNVNATREALKFVVGLVIGLPATTVFYYFQHMDETKSHKKHELEILNQYAETEKRRVYKPSMAKPVFSSQAGAVETGDKPAGSSTPKPWAK